MTVAISARGISFKYGSSEALSGIDLDIPRGSLYGLMGPNGSGKSTFIKILSTSLSLQKGQLHIQQKNVSAYSSQVRESIGVVFQTSSLDKKLTVRENLQFFARIQGVETKVIASRIQSLLSNFEITKFADTLVKNLSGGLVRRAELCLAWVHEPAIVFLDEPTTGLDPVARHEFWQFLLKEKKEKGTTVVLATHLVDEAELCDEISVFSEGKVVASGKPFELVKGFEDDVVCVVAKDVEKTKLILKKINADNYVLAGTEFTFRAPQARQMLTELAKHLGDSVDLVSIRKAGLESFYRSKLGEAL